MKITKFNSLRLISSKLLCKILCLVLCVTFVSLFFGCDSKNNLANSSDWQTERELIDFLHEYNVAYQPYAEKEYILEEYAGAKIDFMLSDTLILTSDNFVSLSLTDKTLTIHLDTTAANILAQFSSENIGATIDIKKRKNGNIAILSQPIIESPILSGIIYLSNGQNLYNDFAAIFANTRLTNLATAYNAKRNFYNVSVDYLPISLALPPIYTNVTPFLENAEIKGF